MQGIKLNEVAILGQGSQETGISSRNWTRDKWLGELLQLVLSGFTPA